MAQYYFDTRTALDQMSDEVGLELSSHEAARDYAQSLLSNLAEDGLPDGSRHDFVVDVKDVHGSLIYTCMLSMHGRWLTAQQHPSASRAVVTKV